MLPEEQLREGPRPGSTATNAPGDRTLVSKSQRNLQHTSTCEILASPHFPNHLREGRMPCRANPSNPGYHAFRSLRYFLTAFLSALTILLESSRLLLAVNCRKP